MRRPFSPESLPAHASISNIDLDGTQDCNLRCVYCFKGEKRPRNMTADLAKTAVDWGFEAMGRAPCLYVNFMGGEPLLRFRDLIVPVTEYGKRKGAQLGRSIQFSATTNLTLITDEILDFWDHWGSGWLISIDGVPELQNRQRPFRNGGPSAGIVERNALRVLHRRPNQAVRSTISPQNVSYLSENVRYFAELGFKEVIMANACPNDFSEDTFEDLKHQLDLVADYLEGKYRSGSTVTFRAFDFHIINLLLRPRETIPFVPMGCGAGRGMILMDPDGDLWPCHRFDAAARDSRLGEQLSLGNIFGTFNHDLHLGFLNLNFAREHSPDCPNCIAYPLCGFGCPASNLQDTGLLHKTHPTYCRLLMIYFEKASKYYERLKDCALFQEHLDSLRESEMKS